jgi:hypothetical protein
VREELVEDLRRQLSEGALYSATDIERAVHRMLDEL